MTSRISYKKIALEDLRRKIWILALSCLGNILVLPVTFLIANRNYLGVIERNLHYDSPANMMLRYYSDYITDYGLVFLSFISIGGALIVGIYGFRYLYSRKMTDLYHSIPITRDRLFLITYLNGILLYLVPLLGSALILFLLFFVNLASYGALAVFGTLIWAALRMIFVSTIHFLVVYHLCLVSVMLSGNAFNAIFLTGILGSAASALFGLFWMLSSSFLDTFHSMGISWEQIVWASPLVSPFFTAVDFIDTGAGFFTNVANSCYEHPWLLRIGTLSILLLNLFTAYRLYRKRPSETAEHGVDKTSAQSIIRIAAALIAGLFGSYLFLMIMDRETTGWHLFGILLCGCLAFGVADIILHMNFHSFFAHKKQMLLTLLAACALYLIFAFDLTGYDRRLPSQEQIAKAEIFLNYYGDEARQYDFTEDGQLHTNNYYQPITYSDLDLLYPLLERLTDAEHAESTNWCTRMDIILDTKAGPFHLPFRRTYRLLESDMEILRPIVESQEYLEACFPASLGLIPAPAAVEVSSTIIHTEEQIVDPALIQQLRDTYTADFRKYSTLEYLRNGFVVGHIDLLYPYSTVDYTRTQRISLPVYSHFTGTIAKLQAEFPNLALKKEDTEYVSLDISTDMVTLFDLEKQQSTPVTGHAIDVELQDGKTILYETVTVAEYLPNLTIEDPEELAMLLPYLHVGDYTSGHFRELQHYQYIGHLTTIKGHNVSCYVHLDELPLPVPASVLTALEETAQKLNTQ